MTPLAEAVGSISVEERAALAPVGERLRGLRARVLDELERLGLTRSKAPVLAEVVDELQEAASALLVIDPGTLATALASGATLRSLAARHGIGLKLAADLARIGQRAAASNGASAP